ncbi:MAG: riboflavin synthase [Planctomycetota bacterium]|jgi:riboflavin synthase
MFTGLVETMGKVSRAENRGGGLRLGIEVDKKFLEDVAIGDSICVTGVCLTVVETKKNILEFDVVPETVSKSTLNSLSTGTVVNYERSLRVGDRLGGHFVTGHIDTTCRILARRTAGGEERFEIELPKDYAKLVIPKGSVALDGISLTVAAIKNDSFEVAVIPHTLKVTTLGERKTGDYLNVEFDAIAKMVARHLDASGKPSDGLTMEDLNRHGFI